MNPKIVQVATVFIAVVLLFLVLKTLGTFLRPFTIAIVLSFLFVPLIRFSRRKKIPVILPFLSIGLFFIVVIVLMGVLIQDNVSNATDMLTTTEGEVAQGIKQISGLADNIAIGSYKFDLTSMFDPEQAGQLVRSTLEKSLGALTNIFTEIALIFLFLLFILPSHEHIIKNIQKDVVGRQSAKFKSAILAIESSIRNYLLTKTCISLGTGVASGIVLLLFSAPFAGLLSVLIFILNFIPNIGSFVAVALAVIVYAIFNGIGVGLIALLILLILVQVIFGNILEPKITGQQLNLSPIIILLGLFFWGWMWGITGMFIAVPLTSIIKIIFEHIESTKIIAKMMS